MSERMAMSLAFVLGTTGVVLMVPFYTPITLILGTVCLVGIRRTTQDNSDGCQKQWDVHGAHYRRERLGK